MARIGLKNFRYSELDANEEVKEPKTLGKAIDCKVSLELNSAELFANDGLAESDYTFNKGTVTITVDDDDDQILAPLLGHTISEDGEVVRKDTDVAPYIAFGRILTKIVGGKYKYKVEYLSKVKFKDTMPDETTKGESIEFTTVSIEGSVMRNSKGEWSKTRTFDKYEEASAYLDDLLTDPKKKIKIEIPDGATVTTLGNKTVGELQDNVKVGILNDVSGSLKYLASFEEFGKGAKGNFLALYFPEAKAGETVTCEVKGDGSILKKPVTVDPKDGLIVLQIANTNQTIEVVSDGKTTKTLTLTDLDLKTE